MDTVRQKARFWGGLLSFAGRLPLSFLYKVGDLASWFLSRILGYRRTVIYTNIARSFPDKTYDEVERIARGYYKRIGELAAETVWFGGCRGKRGRERLKRQHIYEYTNPELLVEMTKSGGVMAMKSHCGNWELLGGMFQYSDIIREEISMDRMFVAYRAMYHKVSDIVFNENRRAPVPDYEGLIEDEKLLRHVLTHRNDRPVYILNTDQYPYQACHFVGTFMNQPTMGMLGGFALAVKLGFAVLYMREERLDRGHYRLTFEVITENASGQDPEELMREYYRRLEADIRKDPVNWLWSHKRWHYD